MMLDLFAGFGGQSEAFLADGWDVLRIDNNPLLSGVERMVITDIRHLTPSKSELGRIEYVHASPPCTEFSMAYSSPRSIAEREGRDYMPDMTWVIEALRVIEALQPRYWSIENVRGSIRYIEPLLGKPSLVIGPYVYWGNFPRFDPSNIVLIRKHHKDRRWSPLRKNHKAKIDLSVSQAFLASMKSQRCITEWF
jgi:hypothetical protein